MKSSLNLIRKCLGDIKLGKLMYNLNSGKEVSIYEVMAQILAIGDEMKVLDKKQKGWAKLTVQDATVDIIELTETFPMHWVEAKASTTSLRLPRAYAVFLESVYRDAFDNPSQFFTMQFIISSPTDGYHVIRLSGNNTNGWVITNYYFSRDTVETLPAVQS